MTIDLKKFNEAQRKEIELWLQVWLDVSVYADTKFDHKEMSILRRGLLVWIDLTKTY
jgi:hypothetical protein